jgi:hypothetical protein
MTRGETGYVSAHFGHAPNPLVTNAGRVHHPLGCRDEQAQVGIELLIMKRRCAAIQVKLRTVADPAQERRSPDFIGLGRGSL